MDCIGVARDAQEAVRACQDLVPDVVILDDERCLSGSDALYRYSGRYTVRDRTLLCDGVEMTPANGCRVTPWGEEASACQVVLWGRRAGAAIEGMMINPGNPHLRFRMTRQTS